MAGSFSYSKAANLADGLLKYFGTTATFTRRVEGSYDPSTGSATVTQSNFTATAVLIETRDKRDTDAIQRTERRVLISPTAAYEPAVGDQIKIGTNRFQIGSVVKVAPAGTIVLYDAEVSA